MSANAHIVGLNDWIAGNVHVWAHFEKLTFSQKKYFLRKMAYGLGQDISGIKFLVVSDFEAIVK